MTRLQRAPEGSGESTGGGGDHVIQRGGVGFQGGGWNFVMLGNGAVRSEDHRDWFGGEVGSAHRAFDAFDPDFRTIHDFGHVSQV